MEDGVLRFDFGYSIKEIDDQYCEWHCMFFEIDPKIKCCFKILFPDNCPEYKSAVTVFELNRLGNKISQYATLFGYKKSTRISHKAVLHR